MNILNQPSETQPSPAENSPNQATTNLTDTMTVSREQLAKISADVRRVSRLLNEIEDPATLDWEEMNDLCRTASRAAHQLGLMLDDRKGGAQ